MTPADLARDRFEMLISPEPNTGCWIWVGCIHDKRGYGSFQFNKVRGLAHRASWTIYRGEIPLGLSVLHKCDCPYCVNPEHLFLGTLVDNTLDMCAKNRQRGACGTANSHAKLSQSDVIAIRVSTKPVKALVAEFNVKKSMIYYIRAGQHWKGI